jgi:WD40 repeat protein
MGWYGAFTPDGLTLASGSKIVNLSSGAESRLPFGEQSEVAVSPDGRLMARRDDDGSIELWDIAQIKLLHTLTSLPGRHALMTFSADGSRLLVVQDGVMAFWGVK